jgi:hypothetical protein
MPFSKPGAAGRAGGNPPCAESGTAAAIYSSTTGARPSDAPRPSQGRGGARNRAGRLSHALALEQARAVMAAAQAARLIGLPFNRHVTIHWAAAGVADGEAASAGGRFLALVRDWLRKRQAATSWAWVRENGDGKGSHVHILIHVPLSVSWDAWRLRRWLVRVSGSPYRSGVIRTQRIGGRANAASAAPEVYEANLAAVVAYLVKGTSRDAAEALGLERQEAGGPIIGKRAGWSENVGRAARARLTGPGGIPNLGDGRGAER